VDDLYDLPNDGMRHELVDGCLVISPLATVPHARIANYLWDALSNVAPDDVTVVLCAGLVVNARTYFAPDLVVVPSDAMDRDDRAFVPADILLVAEILMPDNAGNDLVTKRHYYAACGIPEYWVIDQSPTALTAFRLHGKAYPGTEPVYGIYETSTPFPLRLDLDEL
jgi:Uma2 family endonuclease